MYDGVIFDKDGVLLDSQLEGGFEWFERVCIEAAESRGLELNRKEAEILVKAENMEDLRQVKKSRGLTWEQITEIEREISSRKNQKIRDGEITLFPSTEPVLSSLGVPKSVVSNAPQHTTDFVIEYFGLEKYFEHIESPPIDSLETYVNRRKPNTVMLDNAMNKMGTVNVVMVGDSADDIKAARNAGIDSCLVNGRDYSGPKPDHKLDSLEDVLDLIS